MKSIYSQIIRPGDLCFDIGAYKGEKTRAMLEAGAGEVICVEPQPRHVHHLKHCFRADQRVTIVQRAVSNYAGVFDLEICDQADTIATLSNHLQTKGRFHSRGFKWGTKYPVKTVTLDSLIQLFGQPYFCKIDVETHEAQTLLGLCSPIPYISFEFLDEFIDQAKFCLNRIESLRSVECNFSLGESGVFYLSEWCKPRDLFNLIANSDNHDPEWGRWGDIYTRLPQP